MEYTLKIISKEKLVIESISGEVTLEEMITKTKKLFDHPKYDSSFVGVIDLRKGVNRMSKLELYGYAHLVDESEQFGHAPWAILADDPMVVALSQIFKLRIEKSEMVGVFSTVSEASRFLKRPCLLKYIEEYPCV